jgi:hypothetical protein
VTPSPESEERLSEEGKNPEATNALREKVFKILVGEKTPPGAYLSFRTGGLPQNEYTMKFLKDPSAEEQAADFAVTSNKVPLGVGDWVESGTQLWTRYGDWIDRYVPPPFSLTPDEEKELKAAEDYVTDEKNYDKYVNYRSQFNNAYIDWYALRVLPKADRPPDYSAKLKAAENKKNDAMEAWNIKGARAKFDTQYATMQDFSQRNPVRTKELLRKMLGQPLPAPQGGDYFPTRLAPATLFDEGFSWPKFSFSHDEIHTYQQDDKTSWGGEASVDAFFWFNAKSEGSAEYHEQRSDVSGVKIEFELLRAPIIRPWFSSFLLSSGGWKWAKSTPADPMAGDALADGKGFGTLPMVPTEAIFVRNLVVKLDMQSKVNKESLTQTKSSFEGGVAFFKIKGHVETSSGTKTYDFEETADGIICPQPQIIAYFCERFPALPNPNWNLWDMVPPTKGVNVPPPPAPPTRQPRP